MNRRSFLQFLGIGAATAAVAPSLTTVAETIVAPEIGSVTLPPKKTYQLLYPENVRISDKEWRYLVYLKKIELERLGVVDIQALKRARRNG